MKLNLPIEPLFVLHLLQKNNYDAYIVGGAVRDLFIDSLNHLTDDKKAHETITDFDFTTNATPEQIQEIFPENFYENNFGTVSVTHEHLGELMNENNIDAPATSMVVSNDETQADRIIDHQNATRLHESLQKNTELKNESKAELLPPFEITTYRSEGLYHDHRRPSEVIWGQTIEDDLKRRDFTVNAMALTIDKKFLDKLFSSKKVEPMIEIDEKDFEIIDPHKGLTDLAQNTITTVRDPDERFQEDALRILRGIRFAVQLNMELDEKTLQAIHHNAELITHVSWERIRDEFLKMIITPHPKKAIELLDDTKLLQHILPELITCKGVNQAGHHTTDVWVHSINALDTCPSPDPIVRLATLLHDIGKPATYRMENNHITFYNHEIIGSRIASKISKRLKLSKVDVQRVFILVRYHMFHYQEQNSDASIRRFMRKVGLENIDDILALREGDRLGSGARKTSWRLEEMKQRMIEQLHQPMSIKDLAVDGNYLMENLEMKPGRELGELLKYLFEVVVEYPEVNSEDELLKLSKEYFLKLK